MDLNHQVLNTILSKYLALPIATFPFYLQIIFNNNINYRIEVNYGIKVKFIMDANYRIKVEFIRDVN